MDTSDFLCQSWPGEKPYRKRHVLIYNHLSLHMVFSPREMQVKWRTLPHFQRGPHCHRCKKANLKQSLLKTGPWGSWTSWYLHGSDACCPKFTFPQEEPLPWWAVIHPGKGRDETSGTKWLGSDKPISSRNRNITNRLLVPAVPDHVVPWRPLASVQEKKNRYCAPNGWDLNTRQFIATHKFTQATNAFPFNDIVTKTQDFEECSGRETDRKHVPGQAGTCVYMKEKNRLAEKELLNSTWWSRGLSGEHDIRTDRLKEH